jgi:galactokinase
MHDLSKPPSWKRAHAAYVREFGCDPAWVAQAPGRVNLIGEHTDYNGGFVIPTPMALTCCVAVGLGRGKHRVVASDMSAEFSCDLEAVTYGSMSSAEVIPGSWQSYVFGVLHEVGAWLARHGAPALPPVNLAIASDVPVGGGLSSSAALEVAVARALGADGVRQGNYPDELEVAKLCRRAENRFAGVPCGIMDQLVCSVGTGGRAMVIDCRAVEWRIVPMPDPRSAQFIVIDTRVRHRNSGGEYAARRSGCEAAAKELGVESLREADAYMIEQAKGALTPEAFNCAMHVVSENPRVMMAAEALRAGDMGKLGELMKLSHRSLRDLFRVSCPELDAVVDAACAVEGVFGARMTGAGFGGCVVALISPAAEEPVKRAVSDAFRSRFGREPAFYPV